MSSDAVSELHPPPMRKVLTRAEALSASPLIAYGIIIALQLRVVWNVWRYKDLVFGDTSSYFVDAASWTHGLHDDIIWSPLYTDFWGTVLAVFKGNAYDSEMACRVAIVLAASILVLALMRSLLGPPLALLVAAWWVIVPANYNVLYEVHLFGVLPVLVAALIVVRTPGRRANGIALAILLGTTLLLRNEMLITTIIFASAIAVHEIRERRQHNVPFAIYMRTFGVPLAIACLLAGGFYWRSFDQGHNASLSFSAKEKISIDQAYAFNYQQRHPTKFTGNAFTEYRPLLRQVFGKSEPSLLQAAIADPRAIGGFVLWNVRLLPSGLQVALFNATSTGDQPDYPLVKTHENYALVLSIVVLLLLFAGAWSMRRESQFWRREWLPPRAWVVVLFVAEVVTTLFVVLIEQRPRPEYMYGLTIGIMALAGVCLTALLRRVNGTRFIAPVAIVLPLMLVIALPSYYTRGPRPILDAVNRTQVVRAKLQQPGSVLIAAQFNFEICAYLAETYSRNCTSPSWSTLQAQLASGAPIQGVLTRAKATAIYAESLLLGDPSIARLVAAPRLYGWRQVAGGVGEDGPWHVLVRAN
jgi:hypothetical protein